MLSLPILRDYQEKNKTQAFIGMNIFENTINTVLCFFIDHFHKWRPIINSFDSIKISLTNLILKLIIGHVRYINIQAWLRGFRVKIANF